MTRRRRAVATDAARPGEAGFTLIELIVAMFILGIGLFATVGVVATSLVTSREARLLDKATAVANESVERYRSARFDSLALGPDYVTYPGNSAGDVIEGSPIAYDASCTVCEPHRETITRDGQAYTVTRYVVEVDDPVDGTGGADADSELTDYKRVIVTVDWEGVRSGSHTVRTNIIRDAAKPAIEAQGLTFRVEDELGDVIEDEGLNFPITVTLSDTTTRADETDEGIAELFGIPTGAHTCTVHQANPEWHPFGDPAADEKTVPCNVTTGSVTLVETRWTISACTTTANTGPATITVSEQSGTAIAGAEVTLTPSGGGTSIGPVTSDGSGVASFTGVAEGLYNVAATATGYDPGTTAVCVGGSGVATATMSPTATSGPSEGATTGQLRVTITNKFKKDVRFRLKIKAKSPEPAGWPGDTYVPVDGILIARDGSYTFVYDLEPGYYDIEVQDGEHLNGDGTPKWDKSHAWKGEEIRTGEVSEFSKDIK